MKHITNNLIKYAIPYETKSRSSIYIKQRHVPTILWLRYIFTSAGTISLKITENKLSFRLKKDVFNLYIDE